ncbi:MAG: response regulator [Gammaproteobacteria bacterium]|nr:MAG: response regulator [Gammaproteobacteria bacterium]
MVEVLSSKLTKIYLVDDDRIVCHSLTLILQKYDYELEVFNSAEAFLKTHPKPENGILVLDHNMSGMTGLELQRYLIDENVTIPIIFITALYGTVNDTATKNGAIGVFEKPFDPKELVDLLSSVSK